MALAVCCQWLEPRTKRNGSVVYENSIGEKSLQLGFYKKGKYDEQRITNTYHNNVDCLIRLVPKLNQNDIKSFRMSSNVLPLFDFTGHLAKEDTELLGKFKALGRLFMDNNIRVTCHPGPFCVISSDSDDVIERALTEMEYHAWMFDAMGFPQTPYHAINVHGGKKGRTDRLVDVINNRMADNVRKRLTLENDERAYSAKELVEVYERTGTAIVWDSHHHVFYEDGWTMQQAADACMQTWGDTKPLQHISNTEPGLENGSFKDRRKHSWFIHYIPFYQRQLIVEDKVDVDVEAKGKNLALLKMRKDFGITL